MSASAYPAEAQPLAVERPRKRAVALELLPSTERRAKHSQAGGRGGPVDAQLEQPQPPEPVAYGWRSTRRLAGQYGRDRSWS